VHDLRQAASLSVFLPDVSVAQVYLFTIFCFFRSTGRRVCCHILKLNTDSERAKHALPASFQLKYI
jgi:hypothetical protein